MLSEFILLLSSAIGGVETAGKVVIFGVILENRLSGAEEWSDRNGINCIGKLNVTAPTY